MHSWETGTDTAWGHAGAQKLSCNWPAALLGAWWPLQKLSHSESSSVPWRDGDQWSTVSVSTASASACYVLCTFSLASCFLRSRGFCPPAHSVHRHIASADCLRSGCLSTSASATYFVRSGLCNPTPFPESQIQSFLIGLFLQSVSTR